MKSWFSNSGTSIEKEKKENYETRAQDFKTFFMLNSAENEICSAYKKWLLSI